MEMEIRYNPLASEWVAYSPHRQQRTFLPESQNCPFCASSRSSEGDIPVNEFYIAVVENRFPSFVLNAETPQRPADVPDYLNRPAYGKCEVVVYSGRHEDELCDLEIPHIADILRVFAHRTLEIYKHPGIKYVFIFENRGKQVGATIEHPHAQIYAYPFVPHTMTHEIKAFKLSAQKSGVCFGCKQIEVECSKRERLIIDANGFAPAFVPYYARWPIEVHIYPRQHVGMLYELDEPGFYELANSLKSLFSALDRLYSFRMPYVMVIHQAPAGRRKDYSYFHLHLEIYVPYRTSDKLKYLAGSELGAGVFLNDRMPEDTAKMLASVIL